MRQPPLATSARWRRIATALESDDDDRTIARRLRCAVAHVAHVRAALAPPSVSRHPCLECEFVAKSEAGLQTHITRRHSPPPPAPVLLTAPVLPPAFTPALLVEPPRFICADCGSSIFTSSIRDPRICIRCDLAARQRAA